MSRGLSRRRFLQLSVGAALANVLAEARTPARAQGVTNLTIGMSARNLDMAPVWVAQDRHLFEKYGLNLTIYNIGGGGKTVQAMAAGEVPLALVGGSNVINARTKNVPLEMIGGLITKLPYDFVVAKDITSASQLKGTKGAISGFGASSDFASRFALTQLGVNPQDVTFLQVGNEVARLAALSTGQIQFTVLTAGLDLAAFDLGYKPLLKLYTLNQPYQHTGIGVSIPWAKAHVSTVQSFLKGIIAGSVFIKNPANETAALTMLHTHLPIKDAYLREAFRLYRDQFYVVYPFVTEPGMEFILRMRKIAKPASDYFDNSYVQALQDANFAASAT